MDWRIENLRNLDGERLRMTGRFFKYQWNPTAKRCVILSEIAEAETGILITDWLFSAYTEGFKKLGNALKAGRMVAFDATIKKYNYSFSFLPSRFGDLLPYDGENYRLCRATKVELLPFGENENADYVLHREMEGLD